MNKIKIKRSVRSLLQEILREQSPVKDPPTSAPVKDPPTSAPVEDPPSATTPKAKKAKPSRGITVVKGAYGSGGRFKDFVQSANARAKNEPKALMRDLGVQRATSGPDIAQVKNILKLSFNTNRTMLDAYGGVSEITDVLADGTKIEGLGVYMNGLDKRNGIKFLMHILAAARSAGLLNLRSGIAINKGEKAPILLYSS